MFLKTIKFITIPLLLSEMAHADANTLNKSKILEIISNSANMKAHMKVIKKNIEKKTRHKSASGMKVMNLPYGKSNMVSGVKISQGVYIPAYATEEDLEKARIMTAKRKYEQDSLSSNSSESDYIEEKERPSPSFRKSYASFPSANLNEVQSSLKTRFESCGLTEQIIDFKDSSNEGQKISKASESKNTEVASVIYF